ncbi:hypothetical protein CesoFtcFv8_024197 [Champsocephalus esox]|uniref:Uncharacterized protein n=2 Tax=Champsocephalus esox TaxID=159716 RepID=A0AAN8B5T4_9TELE|nr:hypothetical protein CesoFtcFv8_024197 [Champsocephalus esox]
MGRGVVKQQRRIRRDVLNSTSPELRLRRPSCSFSRCCSVAQRHRGKMNLYRSFGNLMEAWVTEGAQGSDSAWHGNNSEDPSMRSSDVGTNIRTESVDSGVETASSVTSLPPTPSSVSADHTELDSFTPERERDSTSQSPILSFPVPPSSSSSSPHIRPSRAQESSTALELKVEQAIKKTDSKCLRNNPKDLFTADVVLRRRPGASFVSKRPTSELLRGQRSESFSHWRTANSAVPTRQFSESYRRPRSASCIKPPVQTRTEDLGAEEGNELSPGLLYLEQVCQMLEEIAKQQMHSRALQMETDALREHQDLEESQALDASQSDSKPSEEDMISCEIQESSEQISSEPQQRRDHPYRLYRQRSASETNVSSVHLRKQNADCRGQHRSKDDLLEKEENDQEIQESEKQEKPKTNKNWKMKFGSFTRESSLRDSKGQQMQSSERNSARRRLSQLFRRKTTKAVTV